MKTCLYPLMKLPLQCSKRVEINTSGLRFVQGVYISLTLSFEILSESESVKAW